VYGHLTELSDRELANLLWGFAVLGQTNSWVLDPLLEHSSAGGFAGYSAGSMHLLVWSLGKLSHTPSAAWLDAFLTGAQSHFFRFGPTELANIIWALAKLGERGGCGKAVVWWAQGPEGRRALAAPQYRTMSCITW
jgi:hypothetical protein